MKQTEFRFKRRIFGGFDRGDVSRYVVSLAADRNSQIEKCNELSDKLCELENDNARLNSEAAALRAELSAVKSQLCGSAKLHAEFLDEASDALSYFKSQCANSHSALLSSFDAVKNDITQMGDAVSSISNAVDTISGRFDELRMCLPENLPDIPESHDETVLPDTAENEVKCFDVHTSKIRELIPEMHAGDRILLSGTVFTARDAAHKELFRLLDEDRPLPFDLTDAVIYYAGPTPGFEEHAVGSCGPTTSSRMDRFAPRLYSLGLAAAIGKGERNADTENAIVSNGAVYLCATGGAGALIAKHITAAEEIAFPQLGCESIKRFTVDKLPLTVAIDCHGGNIFRSSREKYSQC